MYKSIPHAKFEADSSSSFGDMMSQHFPRKKGTSHQIRLCTPGKRVQRFKNGFFYVQNCSSRPKIDPPCQFQQFSNFSFSKFLGRLDGKRAAATP